MNQRQSVNIYISLIVVAVIGLIIVGHQFFYLPQKQRQAISYYYVWLNSYNETLVKYVDYINKSGSYNQSRKNYTIRGVNVIVKDSLYNSTAAGYISFSIENNSGNKKIVYSLSDVIKNIFYGNEGNAQMALVSDECIVWSSWNPKPVTEKIILKVASGEKDEKLKLLPQKVNLYGEAYFVFSISSILDGQNHVKLVGLIPVSEFNKRAGALLIRHLSYLAAVLIFCLLLIPLLKLVIIQKNEELLIRDYWFSVISIILFSFLAGATWSFVHYTSQDKEIFKKRLGSQANEIAKYFEEQTFRVANLVEKSKDSIHSFGYIIKDTSESDPLNLTSIYLMNEKGDEIGNWTIRDTISTDNYAHREYFKAFNEVGFKTLKFDCGCIDSLKRNFYIVHRKEKFTRIIIDSLTNLNNSLKVRIDTLIIPENRNIVSPFFLQPIHSLLDGKVKFVVSMKHSQMNKNDKIEISEQHPELVEKVKVIACSFEMKELNELPPPLGYNYIIFDTSGAIYFDSRKGSNKEENIYKLFDHADDFKWFVENNSDAIETFTIRGMKYSCVVKSMNGIPGFKVMAAYNFPVRSDARGQGWLKMLFVFLLILVITILPFFWIKSLNWKLLKYVLSPLMVIFGTCVMLFFYKYEIKQFDAWTLYSFQKNYVDFEKIKDKHIKLFQLQSSQSGFSELPAFWNNISFPYTTNRETKKYRNLTGLKKNVFSKGNKVMLGSQMVEIAEINLFKYYLGLCTIVFLAFLFGGLQRSFYILPKETRKKEAHKITVGEVRQNWKNLSMCDKRFLFDLMDDGIANLKNREVVHRLYLKGYISKKPKTKEPQITEGLLPVIRNMIKTEEKEIKARSENGIWKKVQLPLFISLFGIMVLFSVVQENWLKSFVGIVTLLATGVGAAKNIFDVFLKPNAGKKNSTSE